MNILFIGDVIGNPGREAVQALLPKMKNQYGVDFVILNGENSAGGLGITPEIFNSFIQNGIDVVTSGNHIWKRKEVMDVINHPQLLRPANYPSEAPGKGCGTYTLGNNRVTVINLQGRIFMEPLDCPFAAADAILEKSSNTDIIIIDFHAEATSEKLALAWYLDGKVSAVLGTHTHIQTSDELIMPEGTAYISDAGMTGSKNGVIGVEKEEIIRKFITGMPFRYRIAKGNEYFEGVLLSVNEKTGKSTSITRLSVPLAGQKG
ncbi:MAG: TIGR00282 family metallophosphoesterase [Elusimicrobia bacterium]|nr:TIGR00282 family metallophosphoesterase [Elusimicrobiota bacterium]